MKEVGIQYKYDAGLRAYFLDFDGVARCMINVKEKRCFITDIDMKHDIENSIILTCVKDGTLKIDRLKGIYFALNDQLATKKVRLKMTANQFEKYVWDLLNE